MTAATKMPCPLCSQPIPSSAKKCSSCKQWLDAAAALIERARWEGSNKLVLPLAVSLPMGRCWICGQDGPDLQPTKKKFSYVPPMAMFLGGALISMAFRKNAELALPLCGPCRSRWTMSAVWSVLFVVLGLFVLPGLFGAMGALVAQDAGLGVGVVVGLVAWLVGLIVLTAVFIPSRQIKCTFIDAHALTLRVPNPTVIQEALKDPTEP